MKIDVNENRSIELSEVNNSICIKTDAGKFCICQRDAGIEIKLDPGPWHSWCKPEGPDLLGSSGVEETNRLSVEDRAAATRSLHALQKAIRHARHNGFVPQEVIKEMGAAAMELCRCGFEPDE